MIEKLKKIVAMQSGPNQFAKAAGIIGCTEQYVRMLCSGKFKPGWRMERDIEAIYKKVVK